MRRYALLAVALLMASHARARDNEFILPDGSSTTGIVIMCNAPGGAVPCVIGPRTQLPYCVLSSLATAVSLSGCSALAQSPTYAVICAYVQPVVWRDDGVAPTATPGTGGQALNGNVCMSYTANLANFQVIQQAASAILGVSFYK